MEFIGKLKGISKDYISSKLLVTFETDKNVTGQVDNIKDVNLSVVAKKHRKKRSRDANAYYWQLLTQLADKLQLSNPHLHNIMLRKYGQVEQINGKLVYVVVPDDDKGMQIADEAETYHIKPTSEVKTAKDGCQFRTYIMLRGSSTYDTKEMSTLINGLVEDCKEQDIETLTPNELTEMMQAYERNWTKKHETMERFNG